MSAPGIEHALVQSGIGTVEAPVIPKHRDQRRLATGLQHPPGLGERPIHVGDVFERLDRGESVESPVLERHVGGVALDQFRRRQAVADPARRSQLVGAHIKTNGTATIPDRQREFADQMPAAATEIEDSLPRFDRQRLEDRHAPRDALRAFCDAALPEAEITAEIHRFPPVQ